MPSCHPCQWVPRQSSSPRPRRQGPRQRSLELRLEVQLVLASVDRRNDTKPGVGFGISGAQRAMLFQCAGKVVQSTMGTVKLERISLTRLRAFDAVARHLSFNRAAAGLGRSQATISVQVRELERELEVQLLDRTTRRVALTEAGEALARGLEKGFEVIAA